MVASKLVIESLTALLIGSVAVTARILSALAVEGCKCQERVSVCTTIS